ncbi:MAG: polysaccharide biosynthesis tyrosine autokinase [Bacteroidales bacterium]|nr:polysaccharide biosynthesis tyrosine autokinase [Bacteroidales bacterium]
MEKQYPQYNQEIEEEESFINIDFKKLWSDVIALWWLFVISIAIALIAVRIYHRYKIPVYSSTVSVILDDQSQNTYSPKGQSMIEGFMVDPGMRNIDNQIAVLQSYTLVSKVVERMGIFISYYHQGRLVTTEQYGFEAFKVIMDSTHVQPLNVPIYINDIDENTYSIKINAEKVTLYNYKTRQYDSKYEAIDMDVKCRYGDPIVTPWGAFSVVRQKGFGDGEFFMFNDPDDVIGRFRNSLSVNRDEKSNSSVVDLYVSGPNISKNNDFLNALVGTFIGENLAQKNLIAENTIRFIEDQLGSIADTLNDIGTKLSAFKVAHGLQQTLPSKGEAKFKEIQGYEQEIKQQQLLGAYYDYLASYFANDSVLNGVIAPAIYRTNESAAIAEQLNQIMSYNAEKQAYQDTFGQSSNPMAKSVIAKLQIARNTLLQSIESHKQRVVNEIAELNNKIKDVEGELSTLPETERKLLGVERKYTLNNDVYTYLLRKRSESQIQKASNTPDHRILDAASLVGQVSPNSKKNQTMALALAIILPLGFIVLRQLLDDKLRTEEDIKKITQLPVIGEITSNHKDTPLVVMEYPKSILSESFRRMRSRLAFMVGGKEVPIVAVTSSMPGEGKTFCAANIASVFAISGKKTVLLGFDLRKPGLSKLFKTDDHVGLSNYIIGDCTLEEMTINIADNFDLLPSGAIPPNPAELIASERCVALIEELKKRYDMIIIDTPPMGLVSDAYSIARWIDTLVFIARQDYTLKDAFKYTINSLAEEGITNVGLIINDVNNKKSRYGYGYGHYGKYGKYGHYGKKYGYGYGYVSEQSHGYYTEE